MCNKKEWSIYFYLNGNNELEPEMWQSMKEIINSDISEDINVIIQISREDRDITKIMRPQEVFDDYDGIFTGTRRYLIKKNYPVLLEDLKDINMANYETLEEFIKWGIKKYKAKRNMVIVAGHGFMVASLSDLTGEQPYTMGVYEMCKAFNDIFAESGEKIDILLLDICYMNNIEILYELAKYKENTVEKLITYIEDGPIKGLTYSKLFSTLNSFGKYDDVNFILEKMIINLEANLVAVSLNNEIMLQIKELFNELGYEILRNQEEAENFKREDLNRLIHNFYIDKVKSLLEKIIIFYNQDTIGNRNVLNIFRDDVYNIQNKEAFLRYYEKLSFGRESYWGNFIAGRKIDMDLKKSISKPELSVLTKDNIYAFIKIFNINYPKEKIIEILENLYKYKKW